ncbi:hypothetical protein [Bradyrhizobium sp. LTSP885]|uniref:hypothetical protein n=1 Tax=Bradyrhizobium sp. LTSP885 TaxID=1619232 RepID=UPI0012E052CB|nr:hypothetical protein [Bradyrhizobium sp. LTSP885]
MSIWIGPADLKAQQTPVYVAGNAAVTGFSGALPPVQIAAGVNPNSKTFIDLNGPSLRVVDLQTMGGPAKAQLVGAPKLFTFPAAAIGQVFGVAIDDASPPNIYAAASSAYGLPIVAPGADGRAEHVARGAPKAAFMPGLWGPQGGPGSIWKIEGLSGKVSLLANVARDGRRNSGAALGGLAYNPEAPSLYVADRESGMIHHLAMNGGNLGSYDHGVTGRAAQGLPQLPWNPQPAVDVASPQFDSTQPATWNYAAAERRIFGLAVDQHRLYYAVADGLQIWSVSLGPDGGFGNDAEIELVVPPAAGPTEISGITFDEQGRMYLADRPAPSGAFDFEALAVGGIGRVLRYAVTGTMPDGRRVWQQAPDPYATGFPQRFRNGNGGVAIGYNYDRLGNLVARTCGGFMWTTGEDLRHPADDALAAQLAKSGALDINGLQGNGTWATHRDGEPPLDSYFIDDFDSVPDVAPDAAARGHMGDVAIKRQCSDAMRASLRTGGLQPGGAPPPVGSSPPDGGNPPNKPPPPPPNTPPGGCAPGQVRRGATQDCSSCSRPNVLIGGVCCSPAQISVTSGACSNSSCQAGQTPIPPSNFCCNSGQVYTGAGGAPACCSTPLVNGTCPTPPPPTSGCGKGYVPIGKSCCLASQLTSTGICCPAGQTPSGPNKSQCEILIPIKPPMCCAPGKIPTVGGQCCVASHVTTGGVCCNGPLDPAHRGSCEKLIPLVGCATGYTRMPDGSCCNARFVGADGKSCRTGLPSSPVVPLIPPARGGCGAGLIRDRDGDCVRPPAAPSPACPRGTIRLGDGECVAAGPPPCPMGMVRTPRGFCVPVGPRRFGPGGYPGGPPFGPPRFGGPGRFGPPMGRPGPFRRW